MQVVFTGVMQVVFINQCEYCEISNVIFSFSKAKDKLIMK